MLLGQVGDGRGGLRIFLDDEVFGERRVVADRHTNGVLPRGGEWTGSRSLPQNHPLERRRIRVLQIPRVAIDPLACRDARRPAETAAATAAPTAAPPGIRDGIGR